MTMSTSARWETGSTHLGLTWLLLLQHFLNISPFLSTLIWIFAPQPWINLPLRVAPFFAACSSPWLFSKCQIYGVRTHWGALCNEDTLSLVIRVKTESFAGDLCASSAPLKPLKRCFSCKHQVVFKHVQDWSSTQDWVLPPNKHRSTDSAQ